MIIDAYPLSWPSGYPRSKPQMSRFGGITLFQSRQEVYEEVRILIGKSKLDRYDCIISSNMKTRKDGEVYSNAKEPEDSGVAVYFMYKDTQRVFACDKWLYVRHNLHAIAKSISAIRGLDRWGVSEMLDRIFTGFIGITDDAGKDVGIFEINSSTTIEDIKRQYKQMAKERHPDNGGDENLMIELNSAYQQTISMFTH